MKSKKSFNLARKVDYMLLKQKVLSEFGKHQADTGSVEAQVACLTARISYLNNHLKQHPKDYASRRGLLKLVGQRRRFLRYLRRKNDEAFLSLIKKLKIREASI